MNKHLRMWQEDDKIKVECPEEYRLIEVNGERGVWVTEAVLRELLCKCSIEHGIFELIDALRERMQP